MKKRTLIISMFLLGLVGIMLWSNPSKQRGGIKPGAAAAKLAGSSYKPTTKNDVTADKNLKRSASALAIKPFDQSSALLANDPNELFPNAEMFGADDQAEAASIRFLANLLDDYRVIAKTGGYPTGLNVEITNALLGDNPKKVALINRAHSRINNDGELVDQWGGTYFFHANSLSDMSIRSAGQDGSMYTQDDIISENR